MTHAQIRALLRSGRPLPPIAGGAIDVNYIPYANIAGMGLPGAGVNLGARATNALGTAAAGGMSGVSGGPNPTPGTTAGAVAGGPGIYGSGKLLGQPFMWWALFAGLVVVIWFIAERGGERADFSNLKASFLSVMLLTLVPIAAIPVWKTVINTLWPGSSIATYVNAV